VRVSNPPAGRTGVHLHMSLVTVVEHSCQPIELPIRSRNICEPIAKKRYRGAIELPEGADSIERFLRDAVQYGRLEQGLTGDGKDIALLFSPMLRTANPLQHTESSVGRG
jgi:hypothetical protein